MQTITKQLVLTTLFLLFILANLFAAIHPKAGTSAFQDLLGINYDARSYALGGASAALPNDIYSVYANPAVLAFLNKSALGVGYVPFLEDIGATVVSFGAPLSIYNKKALGSANATLHYLSFGTLEGVDDQNLPTNQSWSPYALDAKISYGYSLFSGFGIGASLSGLYGKINGTSNQEYSAKALTFDLGAQFRTPNSNFIAGLSLRNIGFLLSEYYAIDEYPPLPLAATIGLSVIPSFSPNLRVLADLAKARDSYLEGKIGLEISLIEQAFALRIGYGFDTQDLVEGINKLSGNPDPTYMKNSFNALSLGIGAKTDVSRHPIKFDIAMQLRKVGFSPGFLLSLSAGL